MNPSNWTWMRQVTLQQRISKKRPKIQNHKMLYQ